MNKAKFSPQEEKLISQIVNDQHEKLQKVKNLDEQAH